MTATDDGDKNDNATKRTDESLLQIGKLAYKLHLISKQQYQKTLQYFHRYNKAGKSVSFGKLLVHLRFISKKQLVALVNRNKYRTIHKSDKEFGQLAIDRGFCSREQIDKVLEQQKKIYETKHKIISLGTLLMRKQLLTADQRMELLQQQKRSFHEADHESEEPEQIEEAASDSSLQITVDKGGLTAQLQIFSAYEGDDGLHELHDLIAKNKIVHGLVSDEALQEMLASEKGEWTIATATEPLPGKSGRIEYKFDTDPLKIGRIKDGDVIDYKDRGKIPMVVQGEVLAIRIPAEPGTPGKDIFGKEIAPLKPSEAKIMCSKGTKLSDDKMQAVAAISGIPSVNATGQLFVFPTHQIKGDVDYKSGNIDFHGEIQVSGAVHDGFSIKGGSLTTQEIGAATIEVDGDITVQGGIIGAKIVCGGNLHAHYIHDATIDIAGDLVVDKEIMESVIDVGGGVYAERATMYGTTISSSSNIVLKDIGAEEGSAISLIKLGTCQQIRNKIVVQQQLIEGSSQQLQDIDAQILLHTQHYEDINQQIAELAQVQDLSQVELKKLQQEFAGIDNKKSMLAVKLSQQMEQLTAKIAVTEKTLDDMFTQQDEIDLQKRELAKTIEDIRKVQQAKQDELDVLQQQLDEKGKNAHLKVTQVLYPGNKLETNHCSITAKQPYKRIDIHEEFVEQIEDGIENNRWELKIASLK